MAKAESTETLMSTDEMRVKKTGLLLGVVKEHLPPSCWGYGLHCFSTVYWLYQILCSFLSCGPSAPPGGQSV